MITSGGRGPRRSPSRPGSTAAHLPRGHRGGRVDRAAPVGGHATRGCDAACPDGRRTGGPCGPPRRRRPGRPGSTGTGEERAMGPPVVGQVAAGPGLGEAGPAQVESRGQGRGRGGGAQRRGTGDADHADEGHDGDGRGRPAERRRAGTACKPKPRRANAPHRQVEHPSVGRSPGSLQGRSTEFDCARVGEGVGKGKGAMTESGGR